MLLNTTRSTDTNSLLESFSTLLGSDSWEDLVVGLLRATRAWLNADEVRFWQVDATAGGLRAKWSVNSTGVHEDQPGKVRSFQQPLDEEESPLPVRMSKTAEGWCLDVSCRAKGGELGLLEVRGAGIAPESTLVSLWVGLAGNALVRGREALRERHQAGGLRRIAGVGRELSSIEDLDRFWQRVVEIARESFGIERCAVLLVSSDPGILQGCWGTDFDGRTIDERALAVAVPLLESRAGRSLGQIRSWVQLAEDLPRCGSGESLTIGSVPVVSILTPIFGLPEGPCWLLTDSALSGREPEPAVQDLFEVYAVVVGQIAGRHRAERALRDLMENGDDDSDSSVSPPRLSDLLNQWDDTTNS